MASKNKLITQQVQTFAGFRDDRFAETIAELVSKIEISAASTNMKWMEELTLYAGQVNAMGQKTQLMEDAILSTMKRLWSEEKLSPEITSQWEGNFWSWAKFVSQRGVEIPSDVTLQNRISVYDFYFTFQNLEGGFCLSPTLEYEIEIKDAEGIVTIEEVVIENPNMYTAAYGKLLAAKGWAVKQGGNLYDKTTAYMLSPRITIKEFAAQLRAEKNEVEALVTGLLSNAPPVAPPPEFTLDPVTDTTEGTDQYGGEDYQNDAGLPVDASGIDAFEINLAPLEHPEDQGVYYKDGALYYQQDGTTVPAFLVATPQDGADHPLVQVGQNYILGRFGIHDEDLNVTPEPVEAPIFALVGDEVILTVNGYTFASLTPEEAIVLFDTMSDSIEAITEKTGRDVA